MRTPENIYNIEEKGYVISLPHIGSSFTKDFRRRHGKNVSTVACGSALGQTIPPVVLSRSRAVTYMPPGSTFEMIIKGSMIFQVFTKF
jgi:hypothetical protein